MSEKVATPIVANTKIARTRAAERMRRCRQRRRDGLRCYRLELHDSEIEALVRRGLLSRIHTNHPHMAESRIGSYRMWGEPCRGSHG